MFNGEELRALVEQASYVAVNDYEGSMLSERTGWTAEQIAARVKALIVTRGGEGSWIYANGEKLSVPVAPAAKLADPTGCGDAYRAGLLYGLQRGLDWATTGRVASLAGSIKMEHHGTQQHRYTMAEFAARYRATFGHSL
jgi:adenosine kinase